MKIFGVELERPSGADLTKTVALATAFLAVVAMANLAFDIYIPRVTAIVIFCTVLWGMVSNLMGIRVLAGWRHLALNVAGSVSLSVVVVAIWSALK